MFNVESPDESSNVDFKSHMNKNSFIQLNNVLAEPSIKNATKDDYFQFQRKGYFKLDSEEKDQLIFNRSVTLRDTWKKNIK